MYYTIVFLLCLYITEKTGSLFFKETNKLDKAQLFEMRNRKNVNIYSLEGIDGYFYGILLPNTTYLTHFSLRLYEGGIWLSSQEVFKNQPKMFQVFRKCPFP